MILPRQPDFEVAAFDWYKKTGVFPENISEFGESSMNNS